MTTEIRAEVVETTEEQAFSVEEIEVAGDEPVTVYGRMQP